MSYRNGDRIFGVETEFGTLVSEGHSNPEEVVEQIKDAVFFDLNFGSLDYHSRDEVFEPAGSGGFLINGARLYIDAVGSHLEYATAECRDLKNLVANDRAGHKIICRAIDSLGLSETVSVYNNSIDHFNGHTFGCHENYLVKMTEDFFSHKALLLYAFLVTRQVFAGVGRVGGHILEEGGRPTRNELIQHPVDFIWVSQTYNVRPDPQAKFQLSQRADHILKMIASRVRFNRAIINPKWEHFYAYDGMHRLHILFGESNQNEYAYALKIGTTSLVLRLVEEDRIPLDLQLFDPVASLKSISRDITWKWKVQMIDQSMSDAVSVQERYLELAQVYRGLTEETDWILNEWESILKAIRKNPLVLRDKIDWVNKYLICQAYIDECQCGWEHDSLHSIDLEYHNIDPEKSLFHATQSHNHVSKIEILDAMTDPPQNTRAKARAHLVKRAVDSKKSYEWAFDWSGVQNAYGQYLEMPDPFDTYDF